MKWDIVSEGCYRPNLGTSMSPSIPRVQIRNNKRHVTGRHTDPIIIKEYKYSNHFLLMPGFVWFANLRLKNLYGDAFTPHWRTEQATHVDIMSTQLDTRPRTSHLLKSDTKLISAALVMVKAQCVVDDNPVWRSDIPRTQWKPSFGAGRKLKFYHDVAVAWTCRLWPTPVAIRSLATHQYQPSVQECAWYPQRLAHYPLWNCLWQMIINSTRTYIYLVETTIDPQVKSKILHFKSCDSDFPCR